MMLKKYGTSFTNIKNRSTVFNAWGLGFGLAELGKPKIQIWIHNDRKLSLMAAPRRSLIAPQGSKTLLAQYIYM